MSSASSTASWQNKLREREMTPEQTRLHQAERALEHQRSSGNLLLRSIDADWLEAHKELLETFIQNPNDPAVLEQIPQSTEMAADQIASSNKPQGQEPQDASHGVSSQAATEPSLQLSMACLLPIGASSHSQGNIVTTGFGESSPAVETPQKQSKHSQGLRVLQSARSDPVTIPSKTAASLEPKTSALIPEVSLAARAGSMGAISMQSSHRTSAQDKKAISGDAVRSSDSDDLDLLEDEPEPEPQRKGPGRKKRTAPVLVETEEGETKYVSPEEFRRLRRRITNRLSARRMRKKHAEERALIHGTTKSLEDERNFYRHAFEETQRELDGLKSRMDQLLGENESLRRAQWSVMQNATLPPSIAPHSLAPGQMHGLPGFQFGPRGHINPPMTALPMLTQGAILQPLGSLFGEDLEPPVVRSQEAFGSETWNLSMPEIPTSSLSLPTQTLRSPNRCVSGQPPLMDDIALRSRHAKQ